MMPLILTAIFTVLWMAGSILSDKPTSDTELIIHAVWWAALLIQWKLHDMSTEST